MEHFLSSISLNSKIAPRSDLRGKTETSTNLTSKGQEHDSTLGTDSQDDPSLQQFDKTKEIQKKIVLIQACQSELQAKFEKVLENLIKQISKKDETNCELELQIADLRTELQDSKKDLSIIATYLSKKKLKSSEGESRRIASGNIQKSISGSRRTIDLSGKVIQEEKKNRSPRMQILKKSFKA